MQLHTKYMYLITPPAEVKGPTIHKNHSGGKS